MFKRLRCTAFSSGEEAALKEEFTMRAGKLLFIIAISLAGAVLIFACGGGGGGPSGSSGAVYLYATDDFMDGYMSVSLIVNSAALINTGSGAYCDILSGPVAIDVPELEGVLSLLDVTQCPAVPYNRIRVTLQKGVALMDPGGATSDCSLVSYKEGHRPTPNKLDCTGDLCTLDITGEVNVFAFQGNMLGLDFDLKEFEVEHFGQPDCSVTMKVSPLHADDMKDKDYEEKISGHMTSLDTDADLFTITKKGMAFTVDYSGASYKGAPQPGLDGLLSFAFSHNLEVQVRCATACTGPVITASKVYVEAEGSVSALSASTFTLSNTAKVFSVGVDYTEAVNRNHVEGPLAEGAWVEAELFGHDGTNYLAREVEVKGTGGT